MNGPIRLRTVLGPFLVGVLVTLGLLCLTYASAAADTGASVPDVSSSAARWYADGRLAGPVVLAVYALLRLTIMLSNRRSARLSWLRAPARLATLSAAVTALTVVLPAAAAGSLTWGGLIMALASGGGLYLNSTAKEPSEATDGPVPT